MHDSLARHDPGRRAYTSEALVTPELQSALLRRIRRAYELARLRRALLDFAPVLAVMTAAVLLGGVWAGLSAAPLLFGLGLLALWYGRDVGRGVLPGALAGALALAVTLSARHVSHACDAGHCLTWCLPACVAGGLLGGALVSFTFVRQQRAHGFWLSAGAVSLLTFALGCRCVGVPGVLAVALGFSAALSLAAAQRALSLRQRRGA